MYLIMCININYLYSFYIHLYGYVGMLVVKKGNLNGISFNALLYWNMVPSMPVKLTLKLYYLEQLIHL